MGGRYDSPMQWPDLSRTQRRVLLAGAAAAVLLCLFPPVGIPFTYGRNVDTTHVAFWTIAYSGRTIDSSRFGSILLVIVFATGAATLATAPARKSG